MMRDEPVRSTLIYLLVVYRHSAAELVVNNVGDVGHIAGMSDTTVDQRAAK